MPDFYSISKPLLWCIDPERAHGVALSGLRAAPTWILPNPGSDEGLETILWDRHFANPIGLAAGFDKHAEALPALFRVGFGTVEVGGVTLRPQAGNPKPRLFRLAADEAVINRMGLNSVGADQVAANLARYRADEFAGPVAINLGLNKGATDPPADYGALARKLAPYADILTINVSSPNTPGLRALQNPDALKAIITTVRRVVSQETPSRAPVVLVKIAPDLEAQDIEDICALALTEKLDGLVVSNTTVARPESLVSTARDEVGGLSGRPLFEPSTSLLRDVYAKTSGAIPLVGVGGISSGADAYAKIRAGASLVQLYSALVFKGPALISKIKSDLRAYLSSDGFATVAAAVGADHRSGDHP